MLDGGKLGSVTEVPPLARELGIASALGSDRCAKLALWQVIARALDQGSRLRAVRLAASHACCDLLGLDAFNEDDLYSNLAWLSENQRGIETGLCKHLYPQKKPELFLYDVTSSYLEGTKNALGAFGFNRDGKRGKMQIVLGLLCDETGRPLSIEVFSGNTSDPKTVASQIEKIRARFGGGAVTLVGDRGMIKNAQIQELAGHQFHYITAITKPQIETLLKTGVLQMELFDQALAEVSEDRARYVLRRNPRRAEEMARCRASKLQRIEIKLGTANARLACRPRSKVTAALKAVNKEIEKLKLSAWVKVEAEEEDRVLSLAIDQAALVEESKLDGCYVLKTDLTSTQASKEIVHDRYKDLALVEQAFRTSKTVELEMRPIHVRLEESTRGHALVVMLAYRLVQELAKRWRDLDSTVEEGLKQLSTLCATQMEIEGVAAGSYTIPEPRPAVMQMIELAGARLPKTFRDRGVRVATKEKLPKHRAKYC